MKKLLMITAVALTMGMVGCNKTEGESTMNLRMKDAPGDFQEVNVEVTGVSVHHAQQGWISLPSTNGVVNLLELQNGLSMILVNNTSFPAGHYDQLRLELGNQNTVMIDSVYFPLTTPSAQQSGLKLNINYDFLPNETYDVLIDFDAAQSIVVQGNGTFSLKPKLTLEQVINL